MAQRADPVLAELLPIYGFLGGAPATQGGLHVLPLAVELTHYTLGRPPEVTPANEAGAVPENLLKDGLLETKEFKDGPAVGLPNGLRQWAGKGSHPFRTAAGSGRRKGGYAGGNTRHGQKAVTLISDAVS